MKNYKYFRVLVCLLLVCALLISISPIKAHATAAAIIPAVVPVSAPLVIGAVLIGLGVSYGVSSGAFDDLIDSCAAVLSDLGDIVNDKINLYVYNNRSYVDPCIIRNVRGHLFSDNVLIESLSTSRTLSAGTVIEYSSSISYTILADCYAYGFNNYSTYKSLILVPINYGSQAVANSLVSDQDGSLISSTLGYASGIGNFYYVELNVSDSVVSSLGLNSVNIDGVSSVVAKSFSAFMQGNYVEKPSTIVSTEQDLSLGVVAPSSKLFEEAYSVWGDLSLNTQNDSDEDMPAVIYPIEIPESEFGFSSITQEDVWEGGAIAVPGTGSGTGTGTGSGTISGTITLPGWVQDGINNLLQGLKDIFNTLLSLPAAIATALWAALPAWMQDGISNMATGLRDILDSIYALPAAIATSVWAALPAWMQDGILNMVTGLQDIWDSIKALPVAIAEALAAVFVPSADYISVKVEALRGEFGFIDSVIATGEFIRDSVSGASGPPVIYVDLGRASSGNYGSQRVLLTDFSWYAAYKGQVDTVLSAALWAFFGWRVFLKLPGIIGGESGYISDVFFPSSSGRSGSDDKKKGGKV